MDLEGTLELERTASRFNQKMKELVVGWWFFCFRVLRALERLIHCKKRACLDLAQWSVPAIKVLVSSGECWAVISVRGNHVRNGMELWKKGPGS